MADEMKQGETYEEMNSSNSDGETPSKEKESNRLKMIGIGAVLVIVVGLLVVGVIKSKNNNPKDTAGITDTEDTSGMTQEEKDWAEFQEETGTDTTNETTETDTDTSYVSSSTFTSEEKESLRKWGYTGDEIEFYESNEFASKDLIASAKSMRESAAEESLKEVSNTASPEYKKLLNMTWLGGKKFQVKNINNDEDAAYGMELKVENVDYIKCSATGQQLFIRVTLNSGTNAFMTVAPDRWVEMKKKGNIVVEYTVENYGDTSVIIDMVEREQDVVE